MHRKSLLTAQRAFEMPDPSLQPLEPDTKIVSVYSLLTNSSLVIPEYQRPYKWTGRHINQLFADISIHKDKSAYRLGTIVLHKEGDKRNIVDGQQRTISLLLAAHALTQRHNKKNLERTDLSTKLDCLSKNMVNPTFTNEISKKNIHSNYLEITRIISRADFTEAHIDFLLNKCEVVVVAINDVSEAFQFFDSQNSRGRDLEPHDLLKAYHLREFSQRDADIIATTVKQWEAIDTEKLATLFSQYLYRIRNWSKGVSARYFGKDNSDIFKGVNIDTVARYPYVEQLRVAHDFVDHYNSQYERKIDSNKLGFPFQLDQTIINGRRFFEFVSHYQAKLALVRNEYSSGGKLVGVEQLDGYAKRIIEAINTYDGRTRTGDCYVRAMFDCLLLYYVDKFDHADISRAIEKIFIWAYSLRLKMTAVQLATMDKHVLDNNLFRLIKEATRPSDFTNYVLPALNDIKSTKTDEIKKLFKAMNYYE